MDAALEVAARDGIAHLSMRAVAAQVGLTVMALYRHVSSKEALLDAMVGRMLSQVPLPVGPAPWQHQLKQVASALLDLARRYPTVLPLLLTRAYVAPEAVRLVQALYRTLEEAGVPQSEIPRVERLLSTFTLGYVISAANNAFWADDPTGLHGPASAPTRRDEQPRWDTELDRDLDDLIRLMGSPTTADDPGTASAR